MPAPKKYVTADELRDRFNGGNYYERLQTGEFKPEITDVGPAPAHFGADARSQIVAYVDQNGRTVAIVHQYGTRYGDAAKDSLPDPKFLFEGGVRYSLLR
jgi:hypothetical protein